jgi:hypothetical protein
MQVVSGCFMGIKAPSTPPACPAGYYMATGLKGAKYCTPCPSGSTSTPPNSQSCTPCPAGTYNADLGGKCQNCEAGYYAKAGATQCDWCYTEENNWTDGKQCTKCPPGSYASPANIKQCHKCKAGVKCCTVNPSKNCPACPAGTPVACLTSAPPIALLTPAFAPSLPPPPPGWTRGAPATSVFGLSSGSSPACLASGYALCTPKFSITVNDACLLAIKPMPLGFWPVEQTCDWDPEPISIQGQRLNTKVDLRFNVRARLHYALPPCTACLNHPNMHTSALNNSTLCYSTCYYMLPLGSAWR